MVVREKRFLDRNARRCAVFAVRAALVRLWLEGLLQDVWRDSSYLSLRQVSRTSQECVVLRLEGVREGPV